MARYNFVKVDNEIVLGACERFLNGDPILKIRDWVNDKLRTRGGRIITRPQVYALVREAKRRGYLVLHPPRHDALSQRLADRFDIEVNRIRVVHARDDSARDHVALAAAERAVGLMRAIAKKKPEVHVGLGAGHTTGAIVRHLVTLLGSEPDIPRLVLHALSAGFQGDRPSFAPVAFFGLFDTLGASRVDYVGLFAPSAVSAKDYARVKKQTGVVEALERSPEIDLVITSLASAEDEHGALNRYLHQHRVPGKRLKQAGWIGDVQYRPYSKSGPLRDATDVRVVTVFELEDLVKLAKTAGKYVVLAAGACSGCDETREKALMPLLINPQLKVWSHLVLDVTTAERLLAEPDPDAAHPRRAK